MNKLARHKLYDLVMIHFHSALEQLEAAVDLAKIVGPGEAREDIEKVLELAQSKIKVVRVVYEQFKKEAK